MKYEMLKVRSMDGSTCLRRILENNKNKLLAATGEFMTDIDGCTYKPIVEETFECENFEEAFVVYARKLLNAPDTLKTYDEVRTYCNENKISTDFRINLLSIVDLYAWDDEWLDEYINYKNWKKKYGQEEDI